MATIYGTTGDDNGNKALDGTGLADRIYGRNGDDWLYGRTGNDTLYGEDGHDRLHGEAGNDAMDGGIGNDTLVGGTGNDVLVGGAGADRLYGEAGADTASYISSTAAVQVSLSTGLGFGGHASGDRLIGIESLVGSLHNDTLWGNTMANELRGALGSDTLYGQDGNDVLEGGPGADLLSGGNGTDWAVYSASTKGVSVNLRTGTGSYGDAQGDRIVGIENLVGSNHGDRLYGTDAINVFWGERGNDQLVGHGGNDTLFGGLGDDSFEGGAGADLLSGGEGTDWAIYYGSSAGIEVRLTPANNLAYALGKGGHAQGDKLYSIENLSGSYYADKIYGSSGANYLNGAAGNDELRGEGGNDTLFGDAGRDRLWGGGGADRFAFSIGSSAPGSGKRDVIEDFKKSQGDKIDVSGIDRVLEHGYSTLTFIGKSGFSAEGQARFLQSNGNTIVQINQTGNSVAELEIELKGTVNLTASDFIL